MAVLCAARPVQSHPLSLAAARLMQVLLYIIRAAVCTLVPLMSPSTMSTGMLLAPRLLHGIFAFWEDALAVLSQHVAAPASGFSLQQGQCWVLQSRPMRLLPCRDLNPMVSYRRLVWCGLVL